MVCFSWAPEWIIDQADYPVSENFVHTENILIAILHYFVQILMQ